MQRQPVSSSNIASIGYDSATELLEVEFLNGGIYHYFNVPTFIYEELMAFPSHGTYLNASIKPNYQYAKA
tara:strand:+ start:795 stop:1004 length:210 start_codon:yes stop_codon:yes gene_type:complete